MPASPHSLKHELLEIHRRTVVHGGNTIPKDVDIIEAEERERRRDHPPQFIQTYLLSIHCIRKESTHKIMFFSLNNTSKKRSTEDHDTREIDITNIHV